MNNARSLATCRIWIAIFLRKTLTFVSLSLSVILRVYPAARFVAMGKAVARLPGFDLLMVPLWYRTLTISARPSAAADWLLWAVSRRPRPSWHLLATEALIAARRLSEAETVISKAKAFLLTSSRYGRLYQSVMDFDAILSIERGLDDENVAYFAVGRPRLENHCYRRAWDAHALMDSRRVRYFVNCYLRAVNYNPELFLISFEKLLVPNGLWADALNALEEIRRHDRTFDEDSVISVVAAEQQDFQNQLMQALQTKKGAISSKVRQRLELCRARSLIESGRFSEAREIVDNGGLGATEQAYLTGLISLYDSTHIDLAKGRRMMSLVYADSKSSFRLRAEAAGEVAISYEESRSFLDAYLFFVSSYYVAGTPYFLPEYLWRYASLCMAQGNYSEAAYVMREALRVLWFGFQKLARTSPSKRIHTGILIPERGAFFIGCRGLGDDILRIAMLDALGYTARTGYGMSVDPRMQSLYSRSFPNFEFVPVSRQSGPFAISEEEYVRLREGIPPGLDSGRIDGAVLQAARRYNDVALTEDMLVAFIQRGPNLKRPSRPLFHVSPQRQEGARQWLATLPVGLAVGISWRSGQRDMIRAKSYTDLAKDWGPILTVAGINFVNLQYGSEPEELDAAMQRHGNAIHSMPGVDLKDDMEDVAALSSVLDLVISPGTAVRELCAAAGATVWSLSTTPMLPDLWRQIEGTTSDRLFPNMEHFTSFAYGDTARVIDEVARRLAKMVADRNSGACSAP